MMLIGSFVIGLALFSYLLAPGLRSSSEGILVVLVGFMIGGYAILSDMRRFWQEIKEKPLQESSEKPAEPPEDREKPEG
jgi:hypothetical protein